MSSTQISTKDPVLLDDSEDLDKIVMDINIKQQRQPRRVKIYNLNDDDESWEDQGTGFCYGYIDSESKPFIIVEKEDTPDVLLLKEFVNGNTQYQKQQDTLIVWTDAQNHDIALSFQEQEGCELICQFIIQVQRYLQPNISLIAVISTKSSEDNALHSNDESPQDGSIELLRNEEFIDDKSRNNNTTTDNDNNNGTTTIINELICGPVELPTIPLMDLETLDSILHVLQMDSMSRLTKNEICKFLSTTPEFLNELISIFRKCEESKLKKEKSDENEELQDGLDQQESNYLEILYKLCSIIKTLVLYNENEIFDILFNENDYYIFNFIGILEYDPEFPKSKPKYREYLQDKNRFKEVFPIENQDIKKLVMTTFNLQFLKDVVLLRLLDDSTINTMSTVIYLNQVEILKYLQNDENEFLSRMFDLYKIEDEESINDEKGVSNDLIDLQTKRDAIKMIHQYVIISKSLDNNQRNTFFQILVDKGLLQMLKFALKDTVMNTRMIGTEIIIAIIEQDPLLISNINIKTDEKISTNIEPEDKLRKQGENCEEENCKELKSNFFSEAAISDAKEESLDDDERLAIVEYVEFVQSNGNNQETESQQQQQKKMNKESDVQENKDHAENFALTITKSIVDSVDSATTVFLSDDVSLLSILANVLITENDKGLITQVYHTIKVLLDPNNFQNNIDRIANGADTPPCQYDNSRYLLKFYEDVALNLFGNFINIKEKLESDDNSENNWENYKLLTYQCELLTLCVHEHDGDARSFILDNEILLGMSEMLKLPKLKKVVKLAILRCIRDIILLNDELYTKFIIKNKIFESVFHLLWDNYKLDEGIQKGNFNLVSSSILEIFNLIIEGNQVEIGLEQVNYKLLIIHFNEMFLSDLKKLVNICTCGEEIINIYRSYQSQRRKFDSNIDCLTTIPQLSVPVNSRRSLKRKLSVSDIKLGNKKSSLIECTNIHNNESCNEEQENDNKKVRKLDQADGFLKGQNEEKLLNMDVCNFENSSIKKDKVDRKNDIISNENR